MDFLSQLQSIVVANDHAGQRPQRYNPRPPGVVREGSVSDAILKYMATSPGMKTESQLIWATKRGHSVVSWSLLYLQRQGLIESRLDTTRNSRYRKYRLKKQEIEE